jgi:hypothetical protein
LALLPAFPQLGHWAAFMESRSRASRSLGSCSCSVAGSLGRRTRARTGRGGATVAAGVVLAVLDCVDPAVRWAAAAAPGRAPTDALSRWP